MVHTTELNILLSVSEQTSMFSVLVECWYLWIGSRAEENPERSRLLLHGHYHHTKGHLAQLWRKGQWSTEAWRRLYISASCDSHIVKFSILWRKQFLTCACQLKMFFDEHLHLDDEIRYILDGKAYFDIRDKEDRWIRIAMSKGDMITLPAGIYHRFTVDESVGFASMTFSHHNKWIPCFPYNNTSNSTYYFTECLLYNKKLKISSAEWQRGVWWYTSK